MKTGLLVGILSFFGFSLAVGDFSSAIQGGIPYWETGTAISDHVWFQVSRTSALEYQTWLREDPETLDDPGESLYLFGLGWDSPDVAFPLEDLLPRAVEVVVEGDRFASISFLTSKKPERNRIVYSLERSDDGSHWYPVESAELIGPENVGIGLERRTLSDVVPLDSKERGRLRLRIRYEPAPTIFAHYMSSLNPGWGALGFLMQPIPAFLRLFHDRPDTIEPVPDRPPEYYRSTGGSQRDQPLIPPGFLFSSGIESAKLEIDRAIRAGLDGFAVNCIEGKIDFVEMLFAAAVDREKSHPNEAPFLLTLSLDINVIPFGEREMLPSVVDLLSRFLALADDPVFERHLARRGGKVLIMGYQSHWIWIDYLHRLVELWELENQNLDEKDERLVWPLALGEAPPVPALPKEVVGVYESEFRKKLRQLEADRSLSGAENRARKALARKAAREEAVKAWVRMEDGWKRIREAYDLLEEMVGVEIFWQYEAADLDSVAGNFEDVLETVARKFPAVNFFLPKEDFVERARPVVRALGAEWGEPIYSQYIAYGQNEQDGLFFGNAHGGDGTGTFRAGWYRAIGQNLETGEAFEEDLPDGGRSSLIQYTTWNDYGEHTHLAPSLQMRFALTDLGRHLIHTWKTGEKIGSLGEQIFLFYRKHPQAAEPFPFHPGTAVLPAFFEVVTILNDSGGEVDLLRERHGEPDVVTRAEKRMVGVGLHVETYLEPSDDRLWEEGNAVAQVVTKSGKTLRARGWEEFTHRPFREDSTLVGASSSCDENLEKEGQRYGFGEFYFSEYGDADRDGLPNWFEAFYFGRGWLNPEEQKVAKSGGDENRDGMTNLEHYRERSHPAYFSKPIPYSENRKGKPVPFVIGRERPSRLQAEEFDRGGPGVAYRMRTYETMRGGEFRRSRNDLPTHQKVDFGEPDGEDWMVGPFVEGEWVGYTVEISEGCYEVSARVREGGGFLELLLDGEELLEAEIAHRGLWSTQRLGKIEIGKNRAGRSVLRMRFGSSGYRLNWIEFLPCDCGEFADG
ncbi:MAG TPA: hypothetical protein VK041_07020 [Opitutales bacterium]|nr:hypothetical protein [Opitutales bacterium]